MMHRRREACYSLDLSNDFGGMSLGSQASRSRANEFFMGTLAREDVLSAAIFDFTSRCTGSGIGIHRELRTIVRTNQQVLFKVACILGGRTRCRCLEWLASTMPEPGGCDARFLTRHDPNCPVVVMEMVSLGKMRRRTRIDTQGIFDGVGSG